MPLSLSDLPAIVAAIRSLHRAFESPADREIVQRAWAGLLGALTPSGPVHPSGPYPDIADSDMDVKMRGSLSKLLRFLMLWPHHSWLVFCLHHDEFLCLLEEVLQALEPPGHAPRPAMLCIGECLYCPELEIDRFSLAPGAASWYRSLTSSKARR
jgi:hypothetical protein